MSSHLLFEVGRPFRLEEKYSFYFRFLVMRLSKPALYQNIPIYGEQESSSSVDAFLTGQSHDMAIGDDHSVLSHLLVLPYSFG